MDNDEKAKTEAQATAAEVPVAEACQQTKHQPEGVRVRMLPPGEEPRSREPNSATEEFNLAMEWLQYSRSTAQVLASHLHEADEVDIHDTALAIEAVASMIREGAARIARAHAVLHWEYASAQGFISS